MIRRLTCWFLGHKWFLWVEPIDGYKDGIAVHRKVCGRCRDTVLMEREDD